MRRRNKPKVVTIEDMPEHLREFDAAAWGWSGPQYIDGFLVTGYHNAWNRWLEARVRWCDDNPTFDWIADIVRRWPDTPWPISDVDS